MEACHKILKVRSPKCGNSIRENAVLEQKSIVLGVWSALALVWRRAWNQEATQIHSKLNKLYIMLCASSTRGFKIARKTIKTTTATALMQSVSM